MNTSLGIPGSVLHGRCHRQGTGRRARRDALRASETVRGLDAHNPVDQGAAERIAINTPVRAPQPTIKLALIRVHHRLRTAFPEARLLLQVHDELVPRYQAQVAAVQAAVVEEMTVVADLAVRSWGPVWGGPGTRLTDSPMWGCRVMVSRLCVDRSACQ